MSFVKKTIYDILVSYKLSVPSMFNSLQEKYIAGNNLPLILPPVLICWFAKSCNSHYNGVYVLYER